MILFSHFDDLQLFLKNNLATPKITGLVPTMGALHEGHFSLIKQCKKDTDFTICSIFVNPLQFNNPEDFEKYPTTLEADILALEEHGCDALLLPSYQEVYPDEASKNKTYELGDIENILEGKFRPGHFQGVCLVVERLLQMVKPEVLFLGQKDFQQCMVIKKLVGQIDQEIEIVICPTLREKSGLAMSSRNLRLGIEDKKTAAKLNEALRGIQEELDSDNFQQLKGDAISKLGSAGFRVEYLELARAKSLEVMENYDGIGQYVILIAAYLHDVRLIDNILI